MGWKEERDALIAQTLAFVEQVTGKPAVFDQLAQPPSASASVEPAGRTAWPGQDTSLAQPMLPEMATPHASSPLNDEGDDGADGAADIPVLATAEAVDPTAVARSDGEATASFQAEPFKTLFPPASPRGPEREMQDEIRARIAKFRAHQERFNKERQEYFASTLARLRASMERTSRNGT